MLRNLSHKDPVIEKEIISLVGKEFDLFNKIKKGGVGSKRLLIKKSDNKIYEILSKSYDLNECNIEIRKKGIIVYFKSKQTTYGLAIPYYKLIIFKVDEKHYTINFEDHFLKVRVKNKSDHKFFFKISEHKAIFLKDAIS